MSLITHEILVTKGFKEETTQVPVMTMKWSWKKFKFIPDEKLCIPGPILSTYKKGILTIHTESVAAGDFALYIKVGDDKPRRFDEMEERHLEGLIEGLCLNG